MTIALITGHTGFKGTWLTKMLLMKGWSVSGYSHKNWSICPLLIEQHWLEDIRFIEDLKVTIENVKPDIIFHLAAQPYVSLGYKNPRYTFETNTIGTLNVVEAANCPVVVVTTDKVLSNHTTDPYTASKIAADAIALSYGAVTARSGNCLGGGDNGLDRIVPDIIKARKFNLPLYIRRKEARRPFQHVLDPLRGYIILAEKLLEDNSFSGGWNFGPEQSHSVLELLNEWPVTDFIETEPTFSEDMNLNLDSSKSIQNLNWNPVWDFKTTINKTKEWYNRLDEGEDPEDLMEEQICEYNMAADIMMNKKEKI